MVVEVYNATISKLASEAVVRSCSVKITLLKVSQNSQENTPAGGFFY